MSVLDAQQAASLTVRKLAAADRPELVGHHLRTNVTNTQGGGASVNSYKGGATSEAGAGASNDASGIAYLSRLICFSGPSNGYHASIGFPFYGRALGVTFKRHSQAYGVSAQIDGVPYRVHASQMRTNLAVSTANDQALAIIATDLDDGPHWGEIYVSPDAIGAVVRQVDLSGILVERAAGYTDPPRFATHLGPVAITSSAVVITQGPSGQGGMSRGVSALLLNNTYAGANRVTVKSGSTIIQTFDLQTSGQPGDSAMLSFDPPITLDATITIQDQQSAANYLPVFSW